MLSLIRTFAFVKVNKCIWWLVAALLVACGREPDARLLRAEALMEERSNSALAILDSIDSHSLTSDADRALFGVLYTQAQYKNYLTPADDSLITEACRYYEKRGDKSRLALASYYQDRVRYLNKNLPMAMPSYFKALDLAEETGDSFRASMACRGISDIYCDSYNRAEELHYARKEYDYMVQCGRQPYLNYAMADYARALHNSGKEIEVRALCNRIADSALKYNDENLYTDAIRTKAMSYLWNDEYQEADSLYRIILHGNMAGTIDTLHYSLVLACQGDVHNSLQLLDSTAERSIPLYNYVRYKALRNNAKTEALEELEDVYAKTNKSFENAINQNLTTSVAGYYTMQNAMSRQEAEASKDTTRLVLVLTSLIIVALMYFTRKLYLRQKKEIDNKVLYADQVTESLNNLKEEQAAIVRKLIANQYGLIDELCLKMAQYSDTRSSRKAIADTVTNLIESLSIRGELVEGIEQEIDRVNDNLFSDFRSAFPRLKESDYRLFLLLILGFSIPSIALLLKEEKLTAVYDRKKRLKAKILKLERESSLKFLPYFD